MITVTILEPGVAEVAGLTEFGISSRWGRATRTAPDSACWRGTGFEICAYGL